MSRAVLLCLVCLMVMGAHQLPLINASQGSDRGEQATDEPKSITLGRGSLKGQSWEASLHQEEGVPCIKLTLGTHGTELCQPGRFALPFVSTGTGSAALTILVAFSSSARVQQLHIDFQSRPNRLVSMNPLRARQRAEANFPFAVRYHTLTLTGPACVSRYRAYGKRGRHLFTSARFVCTEEP